MDTVEVDARWRFHIPVRIALTLCETLAQAEEYEFLGDMVDLKSRMSKISRAQNDEPVYVSSNDATPVSVAD